MGLQGRDIICLASSSWDAMWVNAQHLMHRLAANNRICYVNNLGLRTPGLSKGDWQKVKKRIGEWIQPAKQVEKNLWVLSPVSIPLHDSQIVRSYNRIKLTDTLIKFMRNHQFSQPILWTFLPLGLDLIGKLDESLVIYHCVDDYAANPGVAVDKIRDMENRLLVEADLVITTNSLLYEERKAKAKKIVYFGNVANTAHFEPKTNREIPSQVASLPKPILGYQGNISGYKTDLALIAAIAGRMPDASIVLVGPVGWGDPNTDVSELKSLPNVHFIDRVEYDRLADFVAAFDVGLLPLRDNESTRRSFPMKFYEYMAAGKPIVATDLPAFKEYRDLPRFCRLANDVDSFVENIKSALNDRENYLEERTARARQNSWDVRASQIGELVNDLLAKKDVNG